MYDRKFAWTPRDVSLKMRFYEVLPVLWCVIRLTSRTIISVSLRVSVGSKSGTRDYFN
jgi:hypothetical protein